MTGLSIILLCQAAAIVLVPVLIIVLMWLMCIVWSVDVCGGTSQLKGCGEQGAAWQIAIFPWQIPRPPFPPILPFCHPETFEFMLGQAVCCRLWLKCLSFTWEEDRVLKKPAMWYYPSLRGEWNMLTNLEIFIETCLDLNRPRLQRFWQGSIFCHLM